MEKETINKIVDPTLGSVRLTPLTPPDYKGKLYLRKMRINNEGFDSSGKFFGIGTSVYSCTSKDGTVDFWLQAKSREMLLKLVRLPHPAPDNRAPVQSS